MGNFSYQAAEMLQEILENYDAEQLPQKVKEMHVIEHAADIEHHDMLEYLSREFITHVSYTHIPERLEYKMDFYEAFQEYATSSSKPVIVCGDVNTAHKEIDLARPKDCLLYTSRCV